VEIAEKGVAKFPGDAALHNNLATLCAVRMEYDRAVREYQRAIELKPDLAEAYLDMGIIYKDYLKKKDKAIEAFRSYVALKPEGRRLPDVIKLLGPAPGMWEGGGGEEPSAEKEEREPEPKPRIMKF
jgi:tetratricopeptide (TPR) repeat protein